MKDYIIENSREIMDRTVMVKLIGSLKDSIWLRGQNEKQNFWKILEFIRANQPVRAKELEAEFGSFVYDILTKQINAGMLQKTEDGYILSNKFAEKLRRFAKEWEEFVYEDLQDRS